MNITHLLPHLSDHDLQQMELGLVYAQKNLQNLVIYRILNEVDDSVAEDERQKLLAKLQRLNDGIADIGSEVGYAKLQRRIAKSDSDVEVETAIDATLEAIAEACESGERSQIRKALGIREVA